MITEEEEAQIAMFMRVESFLDANTKIIGGSPEIMSSLAEIKTAVGTMLGSLSEEERDRLLDRYREEMELLGLNRKKPEAPS